MTAPQTKSTDLSSGAKAGISIGVILGAGILGLLLFFLWRRLIVTKRKSKRSATELEAPRQIHEAAMNEKAEMDSTGAKDRRVYEMRGSDGVHELGTGYTARVTTHQ